MKVFSSIVFIALIVWVCRLQIQVNSTADHAAAVAVDRFHKEWSAHQAEQKRDQAEALEAIRRGAANELENLPSPEAVREAMRKANEKAWGSSQ